MTLLKHPDDETSVEDCVVCQRLELSIYIPGSELTGIVNIEHLDF